MADIKVILRYIKVKALAERGEPGERANALEILAKLEREHPGIREEVEQHQSRENNPQGPQWGKWSPEDIFKAVQGAAGYFYNVAYTVSNAQYGADLANTVEPYTRRTRSGRVVIGLKMPEEVYDEGPELNQLQREIFRKMMHQLLDQELDDMLQEEEED